MTRTTAFAAWTQALAARGFVVLPASHAVPVELWLREPAGTVLHLRARGTTLALRRHAAADLTGLLLRAECDCAEHRTAGARARSVLRPGAVPLAEAVLDGADAFGWRGVEAGLLDVAGAAPLFDALLERLGEGRAPAYPRVFARIVDGSHVA